MRPAQSLAPIPTIESARDRHQTKPVVVAIVGRVPVAIRRAQVVGFVVP